MGSKPKFQHILFNPHQMRKMLNCKSPETYIALNDPDRKPFTSETDSRLNFLEDMGTSFKLMDSCSRGKRVKALTGDTANALHQTLLGLVDMTRTLLNAGFSYVLLGKYQSDRLEGEFGRWRGMCGGNYFVSVEQIQQCMNLRTVSLFNTLDVDAFCSVE